MTTTRRMPIGTTFDPQPTTELHQYVPQLPHTERDRRWADVRARMEAEGLDALVVFASDMSFEKGTINMRYLTHIASRLGGVVLFTKDEDPIVWNGPLAHMSEPFNIYKATTSWVADIRVGHGVPEVSAELRRLKLDKGRLGIVGFKSSTTRSTVLLGQWMGLEEELPQAELIIADHVIEQARLIKSEVELDMLRKAGKLAGKMLDALQATARPGVTEAAVFAEMIRTQIAEGGEPVVFNLLSSGPSVHPQGELWHLLHGSESPATPTMRPLKEGDIIITEFHANYGGYLAACEFSAYVGDKPPVELQDIYKVCADSLYASEEIMTAGTDLQTAWTAIRKPAKDSNMDYVELGFHGHGLGSPEFPTVVYKPNSNVGTLDGTGIEDFELQEGMVFGNNLDIHNPAWRTDVGCMLGGMVHVQDGKVEQMVDVPRELPLLA